MAKKIHEPMRGLSSSVPPYEKTLNIVDVTHPNVLGPDGETFSTVIRVREGLTTGGHILL